MTERRQTETVEPDSGPRPSTILFLASGTRLGERYEIRSTLGVLGSSVVYHAYDRDLRRDVALNIVRTDLLHVREPIRSRPIGRMKMRISRLERRV